MPFEELNHCVQNRLKKINKTTQKHLTNNFKQLLLN